MAKLSEHESDFVMVGLVPAIHVFFAGGSQGRGCPAQGRAWRVSLPGLFHGLHFDSDSLETWPPAQKPAPAMP